MNQQFNYDEQIRRVIAQLIRMFSNFTVEYGNDANGNPIYLRIPVRYADMSQQVQTILTNNSQNTMPSAPLFSLYVTALKYARERVQAPTHVSRINIRTRKPDPNNPGLYLPDQDNAYSVDRMMPAPYDLIVKLDLWTTNTTQKLQVLEQILPLFNPSMEVQFNVEYLDWTSLSTVELTDVTWSSRSIPVGSGDTTIDIASLEFKLPIWLTMPAKVSKLGNVFKVITSLFDASNFKVISDFVDADNLLLGTRSVVTYQNYEIFVSNNQIQLLPSGTIPQGTSAFDIGTIASDNDLPWPGVLSAYGNILPNVSEIRLNLNDDDYPQQISGTISIDPTNNTILNYNIDPTTLPVNTLTAINKVIDPQKEAPSINGLPIPVTGQRYLLTSNIGNSAAWTSNGITITANTNDIIEFNGTNWDIDFNALNNLTTPEYVNNLDTGYQLKWSGSWSVSWEGLYNNSQWSLVI